MTFKDLPIAISYKSVGEESFSQILNPMLACTRIYKRSVGFFSSSALDFIGDGVLALAKNGGHIYLATSPKLNENDIDAINKGYSERDIIQNAFINEVKEVFKEITDENANILYELIKERIVDVKIVIKDGGMYHDKLAILEDFDGNIVACIGSNNESEPGYNSNYEKVRVYKSWFDQEGRIDDEVGEFDSIWSNNNEALTVYDFMDAFKSELIERVKHTGVYVNTSHPKGIVLRDYQKEAIAAWEANNFHGFYVMATGTGKTWTAIFSAKKLLEKKNALVVIAAPYKHLVTQWAEDVIETFPEAEIILVSSENANWENQLTNAIIRYKLLKDKQIIVITTNSSFNLPRFAKTINKSTQDKLLIVDEAHRFTNRTEELKQKYKYMLGLSATPYSGTEMAAGLELMNFFGGQVYNLPIEVALQKKFLAPYNYYPIFVSASEYEEDGFNTYSAKMASCFKNGVCIDKEKFALYRMQRLRIISMAEEKITRIQEILSNTKEKDHLIVYCGDGKVHNNTDAEFRHIDFIKNELSKIKHRPSQFTASENISDRMERIESFNLGIITALAAIRCLDEGINIPSIKGALILSSNDNYREFAQRRGRILRLYPGKEIANIYDVIVLPSTECVNMAKIELRRFLEYAKLAVNFDENKSIFDSMLYKYGLTIEDIEYSFENVFEEEKIDD